MRSIPIKNMKWTFSNKDHIFSKTLKGVLKYQNMSGNITCFCFSDILGILKIEHNFRGKLLELMRFQNFET